ncbi:DUF2283 domain-containing protein [Streptomyces sp. NPDC048669]|uniref:DUF2283 domain-containing protein n=1 Tax=Streptomyces sp. NPDC048669 TaxID=3155267 RepID=UPI0034392F19
MINLDFDGRGRLIGIEVLAASSKHCFASHPAPGAVARACPNPSGEPAVFRRAVRWLAA